MSAGRWARLAPLSPLLPALGLLLAHLPGLSRAWSGQASFGCDGALDRCDTLYTLELAYGALQRVSESWAAVEGPAGALGFLFSGLWRTAVEARVLNLLDLILVVWPLRATLPVGPTLVVAHLALLLAAVLAGALFARALGCGPLGSSAGALVVGSSGLVLHSATQGHFAQALIAPSLLLLAGLVRLWRGRRWGLTLTVGAATVALLLYWQNALLLGLGALLLAAGALLAGWPRSRSLPVGLALAALGTVLLLLPAALPVLDGMATASDAKLAVEPWGSPFLLPGQPGWEHRSASAYALLDAVGWRALLSPRSGWLLPALPLLPALALGAWDRRTLPWTLLLGFAALMMLGPLPPWPAWLGGEVHELHDAVPRAANPLYIAVHRWVPSASRMHHALRWGVLATAAVAALAALGLERLAARRPPLAWGLLAAGVAWAAIAGPWPLKLHAFPGDVERATADCGAIWLAPSRLDRSLGRVPGEPYLLQGVAWRRFYPVTWDSTQGRPPPTVAEAAASQRAEASIQALIAGHPPPEPLPPRTCLLVDRGASLVPAEALGARLRSLGAQADELVLPAGSFHGQEEPRTWEIHRFAGAGP